MTRSSPASLDRRGALRLLAGGAAFACPLCALAAESGGHSGGGSGGHAAPHWSYSGEGRPEEWGHLDPTYRACSAGLAQSPINLGNTIPADSGELAINYQPMPLRILNNGHTIQVNAAPGSTVRIRGLSYSLLQFHFHRPSEHQLNGRTFEMEAHFVNRSDDGQLAVLGVFLRSGAESAAYAPVFAAMPPHAGSEQTVPGVTVQPGEMLPRERAHFRYMGSLTTPPCSEGLVWTVFRDPVEVSAAQIKAFAALYPMNSRPVLTVGQRFVLETR